MKIIICAFACMWLYGTQVCAQTTHLVPEGGWPNTATNALWSGRMELDRFNPIKAIEIVEAALKLDPQHDKLWGLLLRTQMFVGRYQDAASTVKTIGKTVGIVNSYMWVGALLLAGDCECAEAVVPVLEWIIDQEKYVDPGVRLAAMVHVLNFKGQKNDSSQVERMMRSIWAYLQEGGVVQSDSEEWEVPSNNEGRGFNIRDSTLFSVLEELLSPQKGISFISFGDVECGDVDASACTFPVPPKLPFEWELYMREDEGSKDTKWLEEVAAKRPHFSQPWRVIGSTAMLTMKDASSYGVALNAYSNAIVRLDPYSVVMYVQAVLAQEVLVPFTESRLPERDVRAVFESLEPNMRHIGFYDPVECETQMDALALLIMGKLRFEPEFDETVIIDRIVELMNALDSDPAQDAEFNYRIPFRLLGQLKDAGRERSAERIEWMLRGK